MKLPEKAPCRHCKTAMPLDLLYFHEQYCIAAFRAGGKKYAAKPNAPKLSAPPLRVSSVIFTDGRRHPILQDAAFKLSQEKPARMERIAAYKDRKTNLIVQCFRLIPLMVYTDEDCSFYGRVWDAILDARKAGARL